MIYGCLSSCPRVLVSSCPRLSVNVQATWSHSLSSRTKRWEQLEEGVDGDAELVIKKKLSDECWDGDGGGGDGGGGDGGGDGGGGDGDGDGR